MRPINRLLIANRGEIARRIMATCRDLGIETVAVFSDADADGAFVADADLAVALGGNTPAESYLRIDAVIDAARRVGADAIHPGYGFLSENAEFAQAVADAGLVFVGPSAEVITVMGSKLEAKRQMADAGVPLLPSIELTGMGADAVSAAAAEVGYPVLIKASAGGGGRGMRIVSEPGELAEAVAGAAREAESAFGDATIYAERYVSPSRHVEVQIFGDNSGRVVHFGERECSIQRRHQKIIEEAPSPSLNDSNRAELHAAAVRAGEAIGYTNAGTVEFLLAPTGEFFFLEVNTRLQVEHPVTEAVFGVDLVALQLSVAAGGAVPDQAAIGLPNGHAIEARLYAEDPTAEFRPSTGVVHSFDVPGAAAGAEAGVRVDSALRDSGEVSQFYDPMIAKVIAHAPTRQAAARRLAKALAAATIDGITTNRDLLVRTFRHPEYLSGEADSSFLERHDPAQLGRPLVEDDDLALSAAVAALARQASQRNEDRNTASVSTGFRNVSTQGQQVLLSVAGSAVDEADAATIDVTYRFSRGTLTELAVDGRVFNNPVVYALSPTEADLAVDSIRSRFAVRSAVAVNDRELLSVTGPVGTIQFAVEPRFREPTSEVEAGSTVATMPGTIVAVNVAPGDSVEPGDVLVVMEAMKMELSVAATAAGTVTTVGVQVGETVEAGTVLATVDSDAAS